MTEPIHVRLIREAERLLAEREESSGRVVRVSESFIAGVEHAANTALMVADQFVPVEKVTAALVAAWPERVRNFADASVQHALKQVATELGVDLDAALAKQSDPPVERAEASAVELIRNPMKRNGKAHWRKPGTKPAANSPTACGSGSRDMIEVVRLDQTAPEDPRTCASGVNRSPSTKRSQS